MPHINIDALKQNWTPYGVRYVTDLISRTKPSDVQIGDQGKVRLVFTRPQNPAVLSLVISPVTDKAHYAYAGPEWMESGDIDPEFFAESYLWLFRNDFPICIPEYDPERTYREFLAECTMRKLKTEEEGI